MLTAHFCLKLLLIEEPGGGLVWLRHSFLLGMDGVYGGDLKMTQEHICHLGCSVCAAASVVPPWYKIKVFFFRGCWMYLWGMWSVRVGPVCFQALRYFVFHN